MKKIMKKHLYFPALLAAALAGCTSSDVIEEGIQSNAIGFSDVVNKPSRAVEGNLTNNTFDNFLVYGYYIKPDMATPIQIFNGVTVHKQNGKWSYDGTRYWVPGYTYNFYAYSCADIALASDKGLPGMSLFDAIDATKDNRALIITRFLCDHDHQHDLVYAENEDNVAKETGNGEVTFKFNHALCKVKAEFTTDFPAGYKITVSNVYLTDFYNLGTFNVGTGGWSNFSTTTDQRGTDQYVHLLDGSGDIEIGANGKVSTVETNEAFLIPKLYDINNAENVKLHFTIKVVKDNQTVLERNINGTWSPQWNSGNIYTYKVNISGASTGIQPIVFAAEQSLSGSGTSAWDTTTSVNMVFGVDTTTK
ncbi:MAG: fimbrillin family protein [Muribaculaceae bacterium]|nr:fimbrillin family protein [Muribaculaceae bacterium]